MWWFFLIQKAPLPEHMIGADPEFFLNEHLEVQNGTPGALTAEARKEYKRCFCTPEAIHASCEDFRAAADRDTLNARTPGRGRTNLNSAKSSPVRGHQW
jgi:haloacetate dehalogenase